MKSFLESRRKPGRETQLNGAANVVQRAEAESKQGPNTTTPSQAESLLAAEKRTLEMMANGASLSGVNNMTYTHVNAPTQFVEANGIRFAHRRFGTDSGVPLLFMQHSRGGMDHWDPTVTDGFAKDRPVILFDNAGVASSSGETPNTIDVMAEHTADFVNALGLSKVDLLGFSIGGLWLRCSLSVTRK